MRISAIPNTTNIPRRADLQGIVNGFTQVSGLDFRFNRLDFFLGGVGVLPSRGWILGNVATPWIEERVFGGIRIRRNRLREVNLPRFH